MKFLHITYIWVHRTCYHKSIMTREHHSPSESISPYIGYLVDPSVWLLLKQHTWNCLGNTGMFHRKLLISFLSLSIAGQIDWHAFRIFRIDRSCVEAKQISGLTPLRSSGLQCVRCITIFLRRQRR